MSDDGNWLTDAVSDGVEAVRETTRSFLGVERERYVCPDCNVACEESRTFDHRRAAFDGGKSPSWYCEECDSHYVREADDSGHTLDLYGRGPPE
ncbi:hypothetical protein M196_gp22 [Halorubrum tailed virus 4]|uniref:Uncharacterized protein n=1 Tax=Halorubrum tailed virus 4 TaxID=1273752 RepID=R4TFW8_9CAUD|nr:hypothetical protein M196_gp22 [Halorubrum tailed virus 4]AGM11116.1 hypothetical protein HRTV4_22 [Halorubrum tailed virus 4]